MVLVLAVVMMMVMITVQFLPSKSWHDQRIPEQRRRFVQLVIIVWSR